MSQRQNIGTVTLIWRQDRLTVLIFVFGAVALAAFVYASLEYPAYSQWVLLLDAVFMVIGIGGYYVRELLAAIAPKHAVMHVAGQLVPVDLYYVKSADPLESIELEEDRYETEIPLVRPVDLSYLFGPDAAECWYVYLRHWDRFNNRSGDGQGIALAGGIPFVHNHSEDWYVKPLQLPPRQGRKGFGIQPTFELRWTGVGDILLDDEPFNRGWKMTLQKRRDQQAMKILGKIGLTPPTGQTASEYLKGLGLKKNELQEAIAEIEARAKKGQGPA